MVRCKKQYILCLAGISFLTLISEKTHKKKEKKEKFQVHTKI